ncbi:MAG: zinc-binding dehydrogenase [Chloroflexota bacterium]|nr:zinc-binding dehydrogenase [Chloroflexota bacterium]
MKTRAAVYVEHGKPLVIDDVDLPELGPSHVAVKLFASGICHSQLHQIHNPNQVKPVVLGHEATGVISAKGSKVTYVKEGDKVMVGWLPRDPYEGMARPAQPSFFYQGKEVPSGGGNCSSWAETTVVDEAFVVKLEDGVATDVTSITGCAVMTGAGAAINTAGIRVNESAAIFGVGGVGLSVVVGCAVAGAYPIIVVDLRDDKLEFAKRFGATHGINASQQDPVARIRELTNGGVDYSFDAIGAPKTLEQYYQVTRVGVSGVRQGGTAVLVGVPTGPTSFPMGSMLSNRGLRGTLGGFTRPGRDFPMYVRWYKEGKLPLDLLVRRRYKLEQINEALNDLERGEIAGRSIVVY